MSKRRNFKRQLGQRRYKKVFIIAVEGSKTEPQYFSIFNSRNSVMHIDCLKGTSDVSPTQVLKRLKRHLENNRKYNKSDEAWIVVDKDQWTKKQLIELFQWAKSGEHRGVAVSNPKFEYWLLLHFEDAKINSPKECIEKLRKYLPDYDKSIKKNIKKEMIENAIINAEKRDRPPCQYWPEKYGTTVYRLVKRILESEKIE